MDGNATVIILDDDHLYGRYEFSKWPEVVDMTAIIQELIRSAFIATFLND